MGLLKSLLAKSPGHNARFRNSPPIESLLVESRLSLSYRQALCGQRERRGRITVCFPGKTSCPSESPELQGPEDRKGLRDRRSCEGQRTGRASETAAPGATRRGLVLSSKAFLLPAFYPEDTDPETQKPMHAHTRAHAHTHKHTHAHSQTHTRTLTHTKTRARARTHAFNT